MDWLLQARDYRGLSFIDQGDWCDPMNMVGYKGKGVSGWLSVATAYALTLWAEICERQQDRKSTRLNSSHVAISYAVFCLKKKRRRGSNSRSYRETNSR